MAWSRWVRQVIWTGFAAAARGGTVVALTVAAQVICWLVSESLREALAVGRITNIEVAAVQSVVWLIVSTAAGLAMGFWFAHFRSIAIGAGWLVWLQGTAFVPATAFTLAQLLDHTPGSAGEFRGVLLEARSLLPSSAMVLAASALLSAAVVPIGRRIGLGFVRLRRRWVWRRERQKRKNSWMGQLLARA